MTAEEISSRQNEASSALEMVPFGINQSLTREDILEFSEKDGDPLGYEQLQEDGLALFSFAKRESNGLSPEDYRCLEAYYRRQFDTPLVVPNRVQKIKKVRVLGYTYSSRLTADNDAEIYAYRPDDYENDDLEDVVDTIGEEHLRAGTIEYFFLHRTEYYQGSECLSTEYCFAFVSWYKNPRMRSDAITTGISETNLPFRKEYESKDSYSILPVHKLYTPIHICDTEYTYIFVALGLTRVYI